MSKQEAPLHQLQVYLPEGSFEDVSAYLLAHKVQLTITRERKTVLGDYRHAHSNKNHRITVNGNLNKYAFLITLLHELAHLVTFEKFGNRVSPHGLEWKNEYSKILAQFLLKKVFPADIHKTLLKTLQNPAASSCADTSLLRVLHQYDAKPEGVHLVEALPTGALFSIKGGRVFKKEEKVRKRFKCTEVKTGKVYLFSPVYEVSIV
ncbi:SprT-like domain-containing protein [Ferruginibacter sp. SUN002]|uniref:SprT-like domain-containing protein n=1 Tax=Ferruginibacter sp. SUN002 TaxID=2937789 RepID=UPI003D369CBE